MKLFKISQDVDTGYDTYDSAIVCSENEEDAKTIHPDGGVCGNKELPYAAWCLLKDVHVEYVGEAKEGTARGVILSSFNAG